jgi:hypothetical protein
MCVPYTGTEAWTESLGYGVADSWRPWIVNEQVAGYILLEQITTFQHFFLLDTELYSLYSQMLSSLTF